MLTIRGPFHMFRTAEESCFVGFISSVTGISPVESCACISFYFDSSTIIEADLSVFGELRLGRLDGFWSKLRWVLLSALLYGLSGFCDSSLVMQQLVS